MNFSLPPQTGRWSRVVLQTSEGLTKGVSMHQLFRAGLLSVLILFAGTSSLQAQQINVTGRVTSVDDQGALPGVSVFVKGTQTGTVTDADGRYTISVPSPSSVLVISFIGYKTTEVPVDGRSTVDVSIESDITQLGEVVVTAFGIAQEKKALVSATQEVAGKDLALSRETNLVDALNAKVAGVQITRQGGSAGAASSIVIRGLSSISGENQPLFVVDGVPINNSYRTSSRSSSVDAPNRAIDINPNDIESINVLKGAAATALYGIQAGSGVVIITTKKGKRSDEKNISVNFSSNFSMDKIMRNFPANLRYGQGDGGVYSGGGTFSHFGPPITTLRYDGSSTNPADPRGNIVDMNHPSAVADARVIPVNNQDKFYQIGKTFDNNLSLSAGNKNSTFYMSLGNYSQTGIIPKNEYNRTSIKVTAETSLTDKLKVAASATYVRSTSTRFGRGDNFADVIQGTVRTPPTFDNSAGYVYPNGTQRMFNSQPDNPFWTINFNPYNDDVNRIIGYVQTTYDPISWLNIMYRVGTDVSSDQRNQRWAVGSKGGDATPNGRVMQDQYNDRLINSDLIATATKTFGDFNVSLMVGHNYFTRSNSREYIDGRNLAIPGLYNISNAQESLVQIQNLERKKTAAVLSRLAVDYKNFIFLELSGRNEWTSTLRSPNNSFLYGSAGLGFVFTDAFSIDDQILSFGKLRGSYAEAGRDAVPYSDQTYYSRGVISGAWGGTLRFPLAGSGVGGVELDNVAGNPLLKPERTKTVEFGTELRFLGNRIGLDVTYYRKVDSDQIVSVPTPGSTGFVNQKINAGEIENKGWEILANITPVDGKFRWNISANFTRNRNMVLDLPVDRIALAGFGNLAPLVKEGEPYSVFYGTAFLRDEAGNMIIDANGFPQINPISATNPSSHLKIGDPNPDWLMGVRNTFSYSGVSLTFLWDFRKGGDVANITSNWQRAQGVPDFSYDRGHQVIFPGVTADGAPNTKPVVIDEAYYKGIGNRNIAERFIEDGSWIRLRDVTLSYAVPSAFASRLKLKRLDLGLYGRNLLLFTGYSGVDPETNLSGPATAAGDGLAPTSIGVDAFGTPTTRSYGVSLNATF